MDFIRTRLYPTLQHEKDKPCGRGEYNQGSVGLRPLFRGSGIVQSIIYIPRNVYFCLYFVSLSMYMYKKCIF